MADEVKDAATEESSEQAPQKKKIDWKRRRLPIIAAIVLVVTAIGVAGWAWHATPECCDVICHTTMGKYYDTLVNDTTTLVSKHRGVANNQCLSCHEATLPQMLHEIQMTVTGTYELPFKKVEFTNDFCLQSGCHLAAGVMPCATESSTAEWAFDPHSTQHGVQQCNSCHLMHDQSVFTCAGCHTFGVYTPVPDGWTEFPLDDGTVTAAPKGWTIPQNFQASLTKGTEATS